VYAPAQLLSVSVQCFCFVFHKLLILNAYQNGMKLAPIDLTPLVFIGSGLIALCIEWGDRGARLRQKLRVRNGYLRCDTSDGEK
jgi:hypothetical protein